MVLSVVSPEPESVTFKAVERYVETRTFGPAPKPRAPAPAEPREAKKRSWRLRLPVSRPRLVLAFKDTPLGRGGRALLRRELSSALALDTLFGNSGRVQISLYEDGLVDDGFSYSYPSEPTYAFGLLGGETDDPKKLRRRLDRELSAASDE